MKITDDLELRVIDVLNRKQVEFIHESKGNNQRLDFYLPDYDVYIEVKKFHTDRVLDQLNSQNNIILIQGEKSIRFIENIL